jgi:hypothetical protein
VYLHVFVVKLCTSVLFVPCGGSGVYFLVVILSELSITGALVCIYDIYCVLLVWVGGGMVLTPNNPMGLHGLLEGYRYLLPGLSYDFQRIESVTSVTP